MISRDDMILNIDDILRQCSPVDLQTIYVFALAYTNLWCFSLSEAERLKFDDYKRLFYS